MLIRVRRYRSCTDYSGAVLSTFLRFLEVRHAKHKFNGMPSGSGQAEIHTYLIRALRHPPPQYTQHRLSDLRRARPAFSYYTRLHAARCCGTGDDNEIGPRLGPARVPPMPASHLGMAAPTPRSDKRQHPRLLRSQQR